MAENSFKIKVETETDFENLKDLKKELEGMKDSEVKIHGRIDGNDISYWKKEVDNLDGTSVWVECDVDGSEIKNARREIRDIDGKVIKVDTDVDDTDLKNTQKEVDDLNGEKVQVDVDVDDSQIKSVRKEVDDLKGEKVQVDVDVDDSQIKNVKKEIGDLGDELSSSLGSASSAVTGVVAGMAGKSIWDTIYGTSKRAETNKILLKNMADASVAYDDLYKTIDSTTDQSLISMQQLIPALNGIKAATGSNASTINEITPQVAAFGQYVYALSGSASKAETAMFDLSKGIKGAYASLDQYGITEDALMRTGLWSGKEDDVVGYMNAVNEVTGSTDELMQSTQGLEALMGKAFSRGGKRIGEGLLPMVKNLLNGFMQLDTATDGWLSTMMLLGGGALSGLTTFLSVAGQAINGIKMLTSAYNFLRDAEILEGIAGWFSISWMLVAIAIGIALGLLFIYLYENVDWFREGVDNLVATLQWLGQVIYSSVMGSLQWLSDEFKKFTEQLGLNTADWKQAVLGFLLFFPQLPARIGELLVNAIAKALGFKGNFTQTLKDAATNSVNNFIGYIKSLPGRLWEELQKMLDMARNFAMEIANILTFGGAGMVIGWMTGSGEHSPGFMYDALVGELSAMANAPGEFLTGLITGLSDYGYQMADSLTQAFVGISFDDITNSLTQLWGVLQGLQEYVFTLGGILPANVDITGNQIIDTILRVLAFVSTLPIQLGIILTNTIAKVFGFGDNFVQKMINSASRSVSGFMSYISSLPGKFNSELQKMLGYAQQFLQDLPGILKNAAINVVKSWIYGTGEHSPGFMFDAFEGEVEEMVEVPVRYTGRLSGNVSRMGSAIVKSFGNPELKGFEVANDELDSISSRLDVSDIGKSDTYIFNLYGDVDSEERMRKFVDAVRKEISWNNITAGRTV